MNSSDSSVGTANLLIPPGVITCCDRLCQVCQTLFCGSAPHSSTQRESWRRPHHNLQDLQASAKDGCHLCNLIVGCAEKEALRELNEEFAASSGSDREPLYVEIHLGNWPRLKIFRSQDKNPESKSQGLFHSSLDLEPGEDYYQNLVYHIPPFGVFLQFFDSEPKPDRTFVHRVPSTNTLHDESFSMISKWILNCRRFHPLCRRTQAHDRKTLPRRLLEIRGSNARDILVRVRQTKDLPLVPQYATLSHRWRNAPSRLLMDNSASFENSVPLDELPKHFSDAIRVCWNLGYEYLWIDSLCIIQDSVDDWSHEAGRMDDIYSNSWITFAATAASDSDCGLNCNRNYLEVVPCRIKALWENGEHHDFVCYNKTGWQQYVESPELGDRAWVVQERLLSPRTIHFAADQIYWECASLRASECLPSGPIPHQPDYTADQNLKSLISRSRQGTNDEVQSFNYAWTEILRMYSRTDLTKESDREIALSGIVTRLSKDFNFERTDFVMGLWKSRLPHQLAWYPEHGRDWREIWSEAPSWSWFSCGGSVEYLPYLWESVPVISVLEIDRKSVHLQGFLCAIADVEKFITVYSRHPEQRRQKILDDSIHWNDSPLRHKNESFTETLFFCPVCNFLYEDEIVGLVLRPTRKENGQYQRVGSLHVHKGLGFTLFKSYKNPKLNELLFKDFDETKGYTIEVV